MLRVQLHENAITEHIHSEYSLLQLLSLSPLPRGRFLSFNLIPALVFLLKLLFWLPVLLTSVLACTDCPCYAWILCLHCPDVPLATSYTKRFFSGITTNHYLLWLASLWKIIFPYLALTHSFDLMFTQSYLCHQIKAGALISTASLLHSKSGLWTEGKHTLHTKLRM